MNKPPATLAILLPLPFAEAYDYLPRNGTPPKGTIVEVSIGKKQSAGVVWGPGKGGVPESKLKPVLRELDLPSLPDVSRAFVDWVAQYTVTPGGAVLKMVFGSPRLLHLKKNDNIDPPRPDPDFHQPELTEEQQKAAAFLVAGVQGSGIGVQAGPLSRTPNPDPRPLVTLLDGVTGSGKTEVFCEAIAQCLRHGKQALLLLPEIAMTAALMHRLEKRFGAPPVQWHSELSEKQRRLNWHAIAQGKAKFVMGARSALFLPYPDLGLIVVDEEHEGSYKQEEGVIYHGRDMAVVRAHLGGIPAVLSSATPSLETLYNVQQKKYGHVTIRNRYGKADMPKIGLGDLRQFEMPSQNFISPPLLEALQKTIGG
ncbi:MAG: primosomal protein N' [Bdellovibrionales bacterium]